MAWKAFSTEKVIEAIGPYAVEIEKLLFLNVCVLLDVFMGFAILGQTPMISCIGVMFVGS